MHSAVSSCECILPENSGKLRGRDGERHSSNLAKCTTQRNGSVAPFAVQATKKATGFKPSRMHIVAESVRVTPWVSQSVKYGTTAGGVIQNKRQPLRWTATAHSNAQTSDAQGIRSFRRSVDQIFCVEIRKKEEYKFYDEAVISVRYILCYCPGCHTLKGWSGWKWRNCGGQGWEVCQELQV